LDRLAVGKDVGLRTSAAGGEAHAAEGERGRRQLEEAATVNAGERGRAVRELALKLFLETGGFDQLVETAPVARTGQLTLRGFGMGKLAFHRWQPEQLCGGITFQSWTNFLPCSIWPDSPPGA